MARAGHGADTEMCFLNREEFTLLHDSRHPDVRDMVEVVHINPPQPTNEGKTISELGKSAA